MKNREKVWKRIIKLYRSGLSMRECGHRYQLTKARVQQIMARFNVPVRPRGTVYINPGWVSTHKAMYKIGVSFPTFLKITRSEEKKRGMIKKTTLTRLLKIRKSCRSCGQPFYHLNRKTDFCNDCMKMSGAVPKEIKLKRKAWRARWLKKLRLDAVRYRAFLDGRSAYLKRYRALHKNSGNRRRK